MLKIIRLFISLISVMLLSSCMIFLLADLVKPAPTDVWHNPEITSNKGITDYSNCSKISNTIDKYGNKYAANIRDLCMIKKGYKFYSKGFSGEGADMCDGSYMIILGEVACQSTKGLSIEQLEKIAEQSKVEQKIKPQD